MAEVPLAPPAGSQWSVGWVETQIEGGSAQALSGGAVSTYTMSNGGSVSIDPNVIKFIAITPRGQVNMTMVSNDGTVTVGGITPAGAPMVGAGGRFKVMATLGVEVLELLLSGWLLIAGIRGATGHRSSLTWHR